MTKELTLPLAGVKVVDLTTFVAGPACSSVLADWGADVIKIEPLTGDYYRYFGYIMKCTVADDDNILFDGDNRNKRGTCFDLKTDTGKEIIGRMLEKADVFVTNFRPKALLKLGMDYESISDKYPKIVYAYLNGYGDDGPDKDKPGFDLAAYFARSGILVEFGEPGTEPMPPVAGFGDHSTGMYLAGGIIAALYHREKTGKGTKVQTSLLSTAIWTLGLSIICANNNNGWPKQSRKNPRSGMMNSYRSKDDRWITVIVLEYDRYWRPFCETVLLKPELADDKRFATQADMFNYATVQAQIIDEEFSKYTCSELVDRLKKADIVHEVNQRWHELKDDPQVRANDFMLEYTLPNGRKDWIMGNPVKFNGESTAIMRNAPRLGEHNDEVLREFGYSNEQIATLRGKKVVK